jgi:hypothetical protein
VTHNPYSPPTADVADMAIIRPAKMPLQVLWAVRALWASIILNFVVAIVDLIIQMTSGDALDIPGLLRSVISTIIWTLIGKWFTGKIAAGRNWARILMLIFTLPGFAGIVALYAYFRPSYLNQFGVIDFVSEGSQQLLAVVALWLVFISPGRYWFRQR